MVEACSREVSAASSPVQSNLICAIVHQEQDQVEACSREVSAAYGQVQVPSLTLSGLQRLVL